MNSHPVASLIHSGESARFNIVLPLSDVDIVKTGQYDGNPGLGSATVKYRILNEGFSRDKKFATVGRDGARSTV